MKEIRNSRLPAEDVERFVVRRLLAFAIVSLKRDPRCLRLETLDEVEELDLVLDHYAITWGANWPDAEGGETSKWSSWDMRWLGE